MATLVADRLQCLHAADCRRAGQALGELVLMRGYPAPPVSAGNRHRPGSCDTRAPPASHRQAARRLTNAASFLAVQADDGEEVISQPSLWVQIGVVTEDDAGFLQAADAAQAGRRRRMPARRVRLDVGHPDRRPGVPPVCGGRSRPGWAGRLEGFSCAHATGRWVLDLDCDVSAGGLDEAK